MKLGIAAILIAIATFANAADRSHNIFDDDWTPPKPAQTPRPPVKPPTPAKGDPPAVVVPPTGTETKPETSGTSVTPPASARRPVPSAASQAAVRKVMKEVFAEQLTDRTVIGRRKLTTALLAQVDKSAQAPVEQFVLLAAAVDSAIESVNLPIALRAADQMAEHFDVDALSIKADAALRVGPKSAVADSAAENISAAIGLSVELARADEYSTAVRVCAAMTPAASSNPALRTQLQQRQRELTAAKESADRIAKDIARLAQSPDDPAANLNVGRYTCLIKSDWETGLPMLAKGSDSTLKAAAIFELSKPSNANEIVYLGDTWWDAAAKEPDAAWRAGLCSHAAAHYSSIVEKISGLRKVQIEKRIAEAGKLSIAGSTKVTSPASDMINLLKFTDVSKDSFEGAWKIADAPGGGIESPPRGNSRIAIHYQPPEEYDFHIEFTRVSGSPSTMQLFSHGNHQASWVAGWQDRVCGFETINGKNVNENVTTLKGPAISTVGKRYSSVVQVRKGGISAYVDGKLVAEYKTDGSDLGLTGRWNINQMPLGLATGGNDTIFHVVELHEISGHGEPIP